MKGSAFMKKKLFLIMASIMMIFSMATPAFAQVNPRVNVYGKYTISPRNDHSQYMTAMYGEVNTRVYLWTSAADQSRYRIWMPGRYNTDVKLYADFTVGQTSQYVLSRLEIENLAYIFDEYETSAASSQIDFLTTNPATNECRIFFSVAGKYLTASSTENGVPLSFSGYSSTASSQKWYVDPV